MKDDGIQILDKRCIKTKRAIKTSLAHLMSEKDLSNISVTELAQQADVNRKTFYSHYSNVYDVLDEIEGDIVDELADIIESSDLSHHNWDPEPLFKRLTDLISSDLEFYRYLFDESPRSSLFERVKAVLKLKLMEEFSTGPEPTEGSCEIASEYIAGGTLAAYRLWLTGNRSLTLSEMSDAMRRLVFDGYNGLVTARCPDTHDCPGTPLKERAAETARRLAAKIQQPQFRATT